MAAYECREGQSNKRRESGALMKAFSLPPGTITCSVTHSMAMAKSTTHHAASHSVSRAKSRTIGSQLGLLFRSQDLSRFQAILGSLLSKLFSHKKYQRKLGELSDVSPKFRSIPVRFQLAGFLHRRFYPRPFGSCG
jgi:hypothetical protein